MNVIFILILKTSPSQFEHDLVEPCFVYPVDLGAVGVGDCADAMWEQYSDKQSHLDCAH